MMHIGRRGFIFGGVATATVASSGCGYILYPERRGRSRGRIDVGVLIVDLVWLIPGLIPGVICLVVDFTTGCIYEGGRHSSRSAGDEDEVAAFEIEVDGRVVATAESRSTETVLRWVQATDEATLRARGRLIAKHPRGPEAQASLGTLI